MTDETQWMTCTQCKRTVLQNECGICLACTHVYNTATQPDSWDNYLGDDTVDNVTKDERKR